MADEFARRLTGASAGAGTEHKATVGVEIGLVMKDETLFGADHTSAILTGYGPIPAALARRLVANAAPDALWLRRLYTRPDTHTLVAMDSRCRRFPSGLRHLISTRDQTCRTPWCDAPIRHLDHIDPAAHGGPTAAANGQGLCERCNHTKQAPRWQARSSPTDDTITITAPTGNTYTSRPPPLPASHG